MPPRRAASGVIKRERSNSASSVSDAASDAYVEAKAAQKKAVTRKKAPAVAVNEAKKTAAKAPKVEADDDEKPAPAKKPRVSKANQWPPAELDPSLHPARQGNPAYIFPEAYAAPNGALPPSWKKQGEGARPMLIGAHVSMAGGPATALLRASLAGANGLALFMKSQRQWKSKPFELDVIQKFKDLMKSKEDGGMGYGPESILVHGSYLINLGNPDPAKWATSYECFKDDIYRCHQLGIKLYNWHPGSTVGACSKEESFALIAKAINKVHEEVPEVITVIENMANAGSNIVGTAFSDIASIIELVTDKERVRVCIDTCHTFAAGYDIRTPEGYRSVMNKFDQEVGNGYLAGVHLNDSKAELGANKDLHENIGLGKIGLTAFRALMRDPLMSGIPLVLETPGAESPIASEHLAIWTREIALLYEIQAIEDDEWELRKDEIEKKWRAERNRLSPPKEKKTKAPKARGQKGNKEKESEDEE